MGQSRPELVRALGMYVPNPVAADFELEGVIDALSRLDMSKKVSHRSSPGYASELQDGPSHRIPHLPRPSVSRKVVTDRQALGDITNAQQGPGARATEAEAAMKRTLSRVSQDSSSSTSTRRPPPRKFASSMNDRRSETPPRQPLQTASDTSASSTQPQANSRDSKPLQDRFLTQRVYPTNAKASEKSEKENLTPRGNQASQGNRTPRGTTADDARRSRSKGPTSRSGLSIKSLSIGNVLAARGGG